MVDPRVPDVGAGDEDSDAGGGPDVGGSDDGGSGGDGERGSDVPGAGPLALACGETVDPVTDLDMGMREYDCACGDVHAVVMDVHPPSRFLPKSIVDVLRETVEAADAEEMGEFGTTHLMGIAMEEFTDEVAVADVAGDGRAGYALVWVTDFDSRRLHEALVELVVELMDHAVSHAAADDARGEFESQMHEFDIASFVDQYRRRRDFDDEHDRPA